MTGTGTQNDPFIVDNWNDFISIDNVDEVYIKWKDIENKVIDFNEIKPEGFAETIVLPRYTDFNGWTLKNFFANHDSYVFYGSSSSKNTYIKNLIFENFYLLNIQRIFYFINLENCIISGILNNNNNSHLVSYGNVTNCSFNVRLVTLKNFTFLQGQANKIKNSDVILDVSAKTFYLLGGEICNAKNCRFSGEIRSSSGAVQLGGDFANVYNFVSNDPLKYTGSGVSVYNSDFSTCSGNENLKPCTSEELKSPEFLYNIGFPIGVD